MDTHSEHVYAGPLEELGRTHSDILGTPEDERFGFALDRASKDIFGISLTQMAGMSRTSGARRFPSGQRTMIWVKRNLPLTSAQLVQKARQYSRTGPPSALHALVLGSAPSLAWRPAGSQHICCLTIDAVRRVDP
jgi:hypothetical protein